MRAPACSAADQAGRGHGVEVADRDVDGEPERERRVDSAVGCDHVGVGRQVGQDGGPAPAATTTTVSVCCTLPPLALPRSGSRVGGAVAALSARLPELPVFAAHRSAPARSPCPRPDRWCSGVASGQAGSVPGVPTRRVGVAPIGVGSEPSFWRPFLLHSAVGAHPFAPSFREMKTYTAKPGEIQRDWYVVDAEGQTLGRLATRIADQLRGKGKPQYTPHVDTGDFVIVVNAEKIHLTGQKLDKKMVYRHSGYPGGLKTRTHARAARAPADRGDPQGGQGDAPQEQARGRAAHEAQGVRRA